MNEIHFSWERRPVGKAAARLRGSARKAFASMDVDGAEVHVLLTGDEHMTALNQQYRRLNETTDVLSFPDGSVMPSGQRLLGQVVISVDTAREQAKRANHSEVREIEELLLHGLLHLLGFDHASDDGEMDAIELRLRREVLA